MSRLVLVSVLLSSAAAQTALHQLNDSPRMDKGRNDLTRRILNLTLEIIHLVTGEDYTVVKKTPGDCVAPRSCFCVSVGGSRDPIIESRPHSLIHKSRLSLLELANKMTELLTGEVPIRCQDVAVYFSMEEWEYLEGHKDLYKNAMIEDLGSQWLLMSQALLLLNDHSRMDKGRNDITRRILNLTLKILHLVTGEVPIRCQDVAVYVSMEEWEYLEGHQDLYKNVMMEEDLGSQRLLMSQENSTMNFGEHFILSLNDKVGDGDIQQRSSGENLITIKAHPGLQRTDLFSNIPNHEELSAAQSRIVTQRHTGEKPYFCSECGKCFSEISQLVTHEIIHTVKKSYQCSECGKSFSDRSNLVKHRRTHTGEKPYSCLACGKSFSKKSNLVIHERSHTGEKPYFCSECGKCFSEKSKLVTHERTHTGERPYPCPECGKSFSQKSNLVTHERIHTGEKPYSCSECGKSYNSKSELVRHESNHTGEKPYSCLACGKSFSKRSNLVIHERSHTGEKPYPCSECGKSFSKKSNLVIHERIHTGEKPHCCPECGKSFSQKANLISHERIHTGEKL